MAEIGFDDISGEARTLYQRGTESLERKNLDYALALLQQLVAREPAFFEGRKALRAVQFAKANASGGGGFFKKVLSGASNSPMLAKAQIALRSNNHADALVAAEQVLSSDPNSTAAHKVVAEAALVMELPQTAILSLEILNKATPGNKTITTQLATALAETNDVERADRLMSDLARAHPHDMEIAQAMKNMSARKTLTVGGYQHIADGQGSFRDALRDKDEAAALEQEQRAVKSENVHERLLREYIRRLESEPNNLKLIRNVAETLAQLKRFDESLEYFQRLKESEAGNDPSLDRLITETRRRKLDHAISQLDPNDPGHADQVAALQKQKQEFLLTECQKRVERFPTDLGIRYEMGLLYFQVGRFTEAIQELQKAQQNPHKRIAAMSLLGQCFASRGINDLAARTFQNAIKEKQILDEEKKELIYYLANVLEKMGKREEAIDQFKLIYETDIGYKDVSEKIDAYYASQGG